MKKLNFKKVNISKFTNAHFIAFIFVITILLTWIVKVSGYEGSKLVTYATKPLGLLDVFRIPLATLVNFIHLGLLVLVIGGFYAVINETGVYSKIVKFLTSKMEKTFLIFTIIILSLLSSFTGISLLIFVFVPLLATVLFKIGYDKKTVLAATIGSILIGSFGATYSTNIATPLRHFMQLDINEVIIPKIVIMIISILLFALFVVERSKKEDKKNIKDIEIKLFEEKKSSKKSAWPLVVVTILSIVFLFVAMYDWFYTFDIKFFQEIHESVMSFTFFDYPIAKNIIGTIGEIGTFTIYDLTVILLVTSLLISWIYNIKFSVAKEKFLAGAKEMAKPAMYAVMANIIYSTIQVTQGNSNIFYTLVDSILSLSTGFNVFVTTLAAMVGSFFYQDFAPFANIFGKLISSNIVDKETFGVVSLLMQSIHSIMMMILPTSTMLILGLAYFEIKIQDWFMYIWKFLIQLFAIAIIIAVITNMFI